MSAAPPSEQSTALAERHPRDASDFAARWITGDRDHERTGVPVAQLTVRQANRLKRQEMEAARARREEQDRTILQLRGLGVSVREVAAQVGLAPSTVYEREAKARAEIRMHSVEVYRQLSEERCERLIAANAELGFAVTPPQGMAGAELREWRVAKDRAGRLILRAQHELDLIWGISSDDGRLDVDITVHHEPSMAEFLDAIDTFGRKHGFVDAESTVVGPKPELAASNGAAA